MNVTFFHFQATDVDEGKNSRLSYSLISAKLVKPYQNHNSIQFSGEQNFNGLIKKHNTTNGGDLNKYNSAFKGLTTLLQDNSSEISKKTFQSKKNFNELFIISTSTGEVFLNPSWNDSKNHEEPLNSFDSYCFSLEVQAQDYGSPPLQTTVSIFIEVDSSTPLFFLPINTDNNLNLFHDSQISRGVMLLMILMASFFTVLCCLLCFVATLWTVKKRKQRKKPRNETLKVFTDCEQSEKNTMNSYTSLAKVNACPSEGLFKTSNKTNSGLILHDSSLECKFVSSQNLTLKELPKKRSTDFIKFNTLGTTRFSKKNNSEKYTFLKQKPDKENNYKLCNAKNFTRMKRTSNRSSNHAITTHDPVRSCFCKKNCMI